MSEVISHLCQETRGAKPANYKKAVQRIYYGLGQESFLQLPAHPTGCIIFCCEFRDSVLDSAPDRESL